MKFNNVEEGTEAHPPGRKSELVGKLAFGSSEKKEEMLEVVCPKSLRCNQVRKSVCQLLSSHMRSECGSWTTGTVSDSAAHDKISAAFEKPINFQNNELSVPLLSSYCRLSPFSK